ncbi:MAG TPA: HD domain-containing protein [Vineibacter sp.]|nr:HD domain-containing protein [Vineibacter sp.]
MTLDECFALLAREGARQYGGEPVSQLAHALQSATQAVEAGEPAAVVIAALFHDIGHLLDEGDAGQADLGVDAHHEDTGATALRALFGDAVAEPVRLHVPAKRWLCFADGGYWDSLSRASKLSLEVQGGVFDSAQASAFIKQPHAEAAVRLRRYDDLAKIRGRATPGLDEFRGWATRLQTGG